MCHFYATLSDGFFSCVWIDDPHEGGIDSRAPALNVAQTNPARNGLHLEGSEFTTKSLWSKKGCKVFASAGVVGGGVMGRGRQLALIAQI